jgi:hypothetical protein
MRSRSHQRYDFLTEFHKCLGLLIVSKVNKRADTETYRPTDRDRRVDRQTETDGWMDRQTD